MFLIHLNYSCNIVYISSHNYMQKYYKSSEKHMMQL